MNARQRRGQVLVRIARIAWRRTWPFLWFGWVTVLSIRLSWRQLFHTTGLLHFPGHALVFSLSALVVCRSVKSASQRVIRCSAVAGYGWALEVVESRLFRSSFEWWDVLADACGVLLFLLIATSVDHYGDAKRQ